MICQYYNMLKNVALNPPIFEPTTPLSRITEQTKEEKDQQQEA